MSEKKPMLVAESPLIGHFYAFSSYKVEKKAVVVIGVKHDVTKSVQFIIDQKVAIALEAAEREREAMRELLLRCRPAVRSHYMRT